jgi:hypothetical protein
MGKIWEKGVNEGLDGKVWIQACKSFLKVSKALKDSLELQDLSFSCFNIDFTIDIHMKNKNERPNNKRKVNR